MGSDGTPVIVFDVGGTRLKYGVVGNGDTLIWAGTEPTEAERGGRVVLGRMVDLAGPLVARYRPTGLAVSTLGLVDGEAGTVLGLADAIPGYAGLAPGAVLADAFGLPVVVENDGRCVALAEGAVGAARGARDYIALTIGTNLGGGIVLDGRAYRGARGSAGEWGNCRFDGRVWERHAALSGLAAEVGEATGRSGWDGRAVFAAYDAGEPIVVPIVEAWFDRLAAGVANLLYILNPELMVIGGGITGRGPKFLDELQARVDDRLDPDFRGVTRFVLAAAGTYAGLIGAAVAWRARHGS